MRSVLELDCRAVVAETLSTSIDGSWPPTPIVQGDHRLTLTSGEAVPPALICHEWLRSIRQRCTKTNSKVEIHYSAQPRRHLALEVSASSSLVTHLEAKLSAERWEPTESLAHQLGACLRIERFETHLQCVLRLPSPGGIAAC